MDEISIQRLDPDTVHRNDLGLDAHGPFALNFDGASSEDHGIFMRTPGADAP